MRGSGKEKLGLEMECHMRILEKKEKKVRIYNLRASGLRMRVRYSYAKHKLSLRTLSGEAHPCLTISFLLERGLCKGPMTINGSRNDVGETVNCQTGETWTRRLGTST